MTLDRRDLRQLWLLRIVVVIAALVARHLFGRVDVSLVLFGVAGGMLSVEVYWAAGRAFDAVTERWNR